MGSVLVIKGGDNLGVIACAGYRVGISCVSLLITLSSVLGLDKVIRGFLGSFIRRVSIAGSSGVGSLWVCSHSSFSSLYMVASSLPPVFALRTCFRLFSTGGGFCCMLVRVRYWFF